MSSIIDDISSNPKSKEISTVLSLVDEIYKLEQKINEINDPLNTLNNKKNIELEQLKSKKKELTKEKNNLKNKTDVEIAFNSNEIKGKEKQIDILNNKIKEYKNILVTYNNILFDSIIMRKYFLLMDNNEGFLSNEQINEILSNNKQSSKNNEIITEIIQQVKISKDNKNNLISNLNKYQEIILAIDENLKMLKEEKNTVNNELVNYISCKETMESIIKINIKSLTITDQNINSNEDESNKSYWSEIINLYNYEFYYIDAEKTSKIICDEISDLLNINKQSDGNDLKSSLEKLIRTEINNFISDINNSYNIITPKDLIENIASITICHFSNKNNLSSINKQKLKIYLSCQIKSLYYENIIKSKLKYVQKDYKFIKKSFKSIKSYLNETIKDLNKKIENIKNEIDLKQEKIKKLKDNDNNDNNLTIDEQNFIQICKKANNLIKEKVKLEKIISEIEESKNCKILSCEKKIIDISNEITQIESEIMKTENELKINKIKSNEEVVKCRKLIADKYNIIKGNLETFKNKCDNININIYNKFIDNINSGIKNKYYKSLFELEKCICDPLKKRNTDKNNNLEETENIRNENKSINKSIFSSINSINHDKNNKKRKNYNFSCNNNLNQKHSRNITHNINIQPLKLSKIPSFYVNPFESQNDDKNIYDKNSISKNSTKTLHKSMSEIITISSSSNNNYYQSFSDLLNKNTFSYQSNNNQISNNNNDNNNKKNATIFSLKMNYPKLNSLNFTNIKIHQKFYNDLNPLKNKTFCYFRIVNQKTLKFNPLENSKNTKLTDFPYNFNKSTISLDNDFTSIKINLCNQIEPLIINIIDINNTIINSLVKIIIEINKIFRKNKDENFEKLLIEIKKKYDFFNYEDIKRCYFNKYYNFCLLLNEGKRYEFLFCCYEEFKTWINGFSFILKNKNEIISYK